MQSLTQFESAVYGEVKLPAAKKTLKKIASKPPSFPFLVPTSSWRPRTTAAS